MTTYCVTVEVRRCASAPTSAHSAAADDRRSVQSFLSSNGGVRTTYADIGHAAGASAAFSLRGEHSAALEAGEGTLLAGMVKVMPEVGGLGGVSLKSGGGVS